jgi:hypothetical protein
MSNEIKGGGCLCGNIKYEFDSSKVISAHHCHCKDCQKSTGSGKATILMIVEEETLPRLRSPVRNLVSRSS